MNIIEKLEKSRPETVMGFNKEDGIKIYNFVKEKKIERIVETGVCYGFSSSYLLEAMQEVNGILISIEPKLMPRNKLIVPEEFYPRWLAVQDFSTNYLDRLLKEYTPVEMFLYDSKHDYENMILEYVTAHNNRVKYIASDDCGGPYCGTVWKDFINQYSYRELIIGRRFRIAERV